MSELVPDPQTKVCPQCAEEVKAAARACRFCSHQFVPLLDGPAPVRLAASPSEQHSNAASGDSQKVTPAKQSPKPPWARLIVFNILLWGGIAFGAMQMLGGIKSVDAPSGPVPWSQLSPGDQYARYGQCMSQVAMAQLAGKFPETPDAQIWCLSHQKDNPASWPRS